MSTTMTTEETLEALGLTQEDLDQELHAKMDVEIPHNLLADIMCTAVESGPGSVWYWARSISEYIKSERDHAMYNDAYYWFKIVIMDDDGMPELDEDGNMQVHKVEYQDIVKGLQFVLDQTGEVWDNWKRIIMEAIIEDDASMIDSDLADDLVQFGLFGKKVYG